jgi:hypothetical protein
MSEDRAILKRNASERIKLPTSKSAKPNGDLMVGGEKLRDKNSYEYLETIRENNE